MRFGCGLVEGFYGRRWSWAMRHSWVDFLSDHGLESYCYAPKSDPWLRRNWRQRMPLYHRKHLRQLRDHCRDREVLLALGLSVPGLQQDRALDALFRRRLNDCLELEPDMLCLLFDDMHAAERAAGRQLEIAQQASDVLAGRTALLICPTWYSDDPRLVELYGPMPPDYLETLGRGLPTEVGVLWCGEQVCSKQHDPAALARVERRLQRKPVLWDNYPVNDGRLTADYLHLGPFRDRPADIWQHCDGHWANPMIQGELSKLPLASLATLYRLGTEYRPEAAWEQLLAELCSPALATLLRRDQRLFQEHGLKQLGTSQRAALRRDYRALKDSAMAAEICRWLAGGDRFDPAVLAQT